MKLQVRRKMNVLILLTMIAWTGLSAHASRATPPPQLPEITAQNAAFLTRFATFTSPDEDSLEAPIWSPDGKYLAVSTLDAIYLYNTSDFAAKPRKISQFAPTITFSPNGALIAAVTYGQDRSVHVYDVKSGKQLYSVPKLSGVMVGEAGNPMFSPDSRFLAVLSRDRVYLLDARTGRGVTVLPGDQVNVTFSPDGSMLATIESERLQEVVTIWGMGQWDRITGFREYNAIADTLAISSNGLIAIDYDGGDIVVYDFGSGKEINRVSPKYLELPDLSFSPNGKLLAAFGSGESFLWDFTTGKRTEFDSDFDIYSGTFNKDGSLLLSSSGNVLEIWSIPAQRQLLAIDDALNPEFSPDGTMLATWGESGVIVWAVQQSGVSF